MFTDIAGYTRLAQTNESLALELLEDHRRVVRPVFPTHGGHEVKTIGDAFLVEFKSALDALLCAVEVQKRLSERNERVPRERKVEIRVGIHLGDVVHESGDIYGDAVNVASRIEPQAEPGGICISQQVYDHVRNKTSLEIAKIGEIDLKNVELPLGIYRIVMHPDPIASPGAPSRQRLAVLPFVNISPDPNDEYFADGLTEELISKLSEIHELKVIARTSVMNYKKKEKKISDIGRELAVGSIIEGSIRKAGNKIRVTVQLIDAKTEEHLWASNYDKELDDIFAIQSDVASKVAGSISNGILTSPEHKDTDDIEAYSMFLRANQLRHESTESTLRSAVSFFERAIAKDPNFARAYAGLAFTWIGLILNGYEGFEVVTTRAEVYAKKALELGPEYAEPHAAMSAVDGMLDRFGRSIAEAEKALEINPNLSEAHISLGVEFASGGDLDRAITSFTKAYELDPISLRAPQILALTLRAAGRVDESMDILEKVRAVAPRNSQILSGLAEGHMIRRDFVKAQEMLDAAFAINPAETIAMMDQGILYALTGRRNEAEAQARVISENKKESVALYSQLFIYATLGDLEMAFSVLNRQAETHSWPFLVKTLPIFEDLRKDPRFAEFCKKVGIEP